MPRAKHHADGLRFDSHWCHQPTEWPQVCTLLPTLQIPPIPKMRAMILLLWAFTTGKLAKILSRGGGVRWILGWDFSSNAGKGCFPHARTDGGHRKGPSFLKGRTHSSADTFHSIPSVSSSAPLHHELWPYHISPPPARPWGEGLAALLQRSTAPPSHALPPRQLFQRIHSSQDVCGTDVNDKVATSLQKDFGF